MTTSVADLTQLGVAELIARFCEAETPTIDEMHGDYDARLLRQPSRIAAIGGYVAVRSPLMPWRSKGFRPVDEASGRGYNSFAPGGRLIRRYPMHTQIAPSRYDGRPAYTLIYAAYRSTCAWINMVDEVRRLGTGVYLGIGTWGFTDHQRRIPLPFVLEQTTRPYLGDLGSPRAGFRLGPREIPALAQPSRRFPSTASAA